MTQFDKFLCGFAFCYVCYQSERAQVQQLDVTHARVGAGVDEGGVDEYQISPLEERSGPAMEVCRPNATQGYLWTGIVRLDFFNHQGNSTVPVTE